MWSDNETREDLLGFKVHAELIKEVILDKELSPVIIGVFGDWGSGKSSVMKILQNDLEQEGDAVACLYFNGWLFEGYDDAKAALLESILEKLAEDKRFREKIEEKSIKLIKSVNWMRMVKLGFKNVGLPVLAAYLTGGTSLIGTVSDKLFSFLEDAKDKPDELVKKLQSQETDEFVKKLIKETKEESKIGVKQFRKEFKEMLDETGIRSLVVLIDDLDRCSPERILESLEAIKLFLNVENTAFIIAADQRLVQQAVKTKYGDDEKLIKEYLEKVIQVPYHLPKLSDSEVETYMSLLFCKRELDGATFEQVITAFHSFRASDKYSGFGYGKIKECLRGLGSEAPQDLEERLRMVHSISSLITKGLEGNPRQIKRYLNAFILRKKLAGVANLPGFKDDVLAKLMILEYAEEPRFKELYNWQATKDGYPAQIKKLEEICSSSEVNEEKVKEVSENWKKANLIKWVQLEPQLSEVDLRDYFWITRDRLSDSMTGALLIPPFVKAFLQELCEQCPSDSILDKKVKTINGKFGDSELDCLLAELKSRVIKNPSEKHHYDIYYYLLKNKVTGSVDRYMETLRLVGSSAPAAPAIRLIELSAEFPQLGLLLDELEKSGSTLGKTIKTQRKPKSK